MAQSRSRKTQTTKPVAAEEVTSTRAAIWTPEKRQQLSDTMKTYWQSHTPPMTGKKLSDETKAKIREKALARSAAKKQAVA